MTELKSESSKKNLEFALSPSRASLWTLKSPDLVPEQPLDSNNNDRKSLDKTEIRHTNFRNEPMIHTHTNSILNFTNNNADSQNSMSLQHLNDKINSESQNSMSLQHLKDKINSHHSSSHSDLESIEFDNNNDDFDFDWLEVTYNPCYKTNFPEIEKVAVDLLSIRFSGYLTKRSHVFLSFEQTYYYVLLLPYLIEFSSASLKKRVNVFHLRLSAVKFNTAHVCDKSGNSSLYFTLHTTAGSITLSTTSHKEYHEWEYHLRYCLSHVHQFTYHQLLFVQCYHSSSTTNEFGGSISLLEKQKISTSNVPRSSYKSVYCIIDNTNANLNIYSDFSTSNCLFSIALDSAILFYKHFLKQQNLEHDTTNIDDMFEKNLSLASPLLKALSPPLSAMEPLQISTYFTPKVSSLSAVSQCDFLLSVPNGTYQFKVQHSANDNDNSLLLRWVLGLSEAITFAQSLQLSKIHASLMDELSKDHITLHSLQKVELQLSNSAFFNREQRCSIFSRLIWSDSFLPSLPLDVSAEFGKKVLTEINEKYEWKDMFFTYFSCGELHQHLHVNLHAQFSNLLEHYSHHHLFIHNEIVPKTEHQPIDFLFSAVESKDEGLVQDISSDSCYFCVHPSVPFHLFNLVHFHFSHDIDIQNNNNAPDLQMTRTTEEDDIQLQYLKLVLIAIAVNNDDIHYCPQLFHVGSFLLSHFQASLAFHNLHHMLFHNRQSSSNTFKFSLAHPRYFFTSIESVYSSFLLFLRLIRHYLPYLAAFIDKLHIPTTGDNKDQNVKYKSPRQPSKHSTKFYIDINSDEMLFSWWRLLTECVFQFQFPSSTIDILMRLYFLEGDLIFYKVALGLFYHHEQELMKIASPNPSSFVETLMSICSSFYDVYILMNNVADTFGDLIPQIEQMITNEITTPTFQNNSKRLRSSSMVGSRPHVGDPPAKSEDSNSLEIRVRNRLLFLAIDENVFDRCKMTKWSNISIFKNLHSISWDVPNNDNDSFLVPIDSINFQILSFHLTNIQYHSAFSKSKVDEDLNNDNNPSSTEPLSRILISPYNHLISILLPQHHPNYHQLLLLYSTSLDGFSLSKLSHAIDYHNSNHGSNPPKAYLLLIQAYHKNHLASSDEKYDHIFGMYISSSLAHYRKEKEHHGFGSSFMFILTPLIRKFPIVKKYVMNNLFHFLHFQKQATISASLLSDSFDCLLIGAAPYNTDSNSDKEFKSGAALYLPESLQYGSSFSTEIFNSTSLCIDIVDAKDKIIKEINDFQIMNLELIGFL